ncbi:hypothetical protein FBU59_000944 [Linderina macrospora]|uniref:Uncharacterized protein n=1 Tax=Linderina macrospora TaxID=4868 RepID=A0ACC1JFG7_9FUNG|nr:hypothetical protein FBU59_000944 [Linderina macrospora]
MAATIRKNPIKLHLNAAEYGVSPLTNAEQTEFSTANKAATRVTPIARAFIAEVIPKSLFMKAVSLKEAAKRYCITFEDAKRAFHAQTMAKDFVKPDMIFGDYDI